VCCVSRQYVEYELLLIVLDLLLLRGPAYRHVLFNVPRPALARALLKLLPAYLCLDVYMRWKRMGLLLLAPGGTGGGGEQAQAMAQARSAALARGEQWTWPFERHGAIIALEAAGIALYWGAIVLATKACCSGHKGGDDSAGKDAGRPSEGRRMLSATAADDSSSSSDESSPAENAAAARSSVAAAASLAIPASSPASHSSSDAGSRLPLVLLALLLSSFGKFISLLPLVWGPEYSLVPDHVHWAARGVQALVWASNVAAVRVVVRAAMDDARSRGAAAASSSSSATLRAMALVALGIAARAAGEAAYRAFVDPFMLPPLFG